MNDSPASAPRVSTATSTDDLTVRVSGRRFVDPVGRTLMLRGVNLGGSNKTPFTSSADASQVSYVNRPFPLSEAPEHFSRLRSWGLTTVRLIIMWEAVEHEGPGIYDQEFLDYLHDLVQVGGEYGFRFFIDLHQDFYSRATGGDGAPYWTVEGIGLGPDPTNEPGAPHEQPPRGPGYWPPTAARSSVNTMDTLFWAGDVYAPGLEVGGVPVQHWLQDHYIGAVAATARRLSGLSNVIGYDTYNEPNHGMIGVPDLRNPDFFMEFVGKHSAPGEPAPSYWDLILAASGFTPEASDVPPNRLWVDGADDIWRSYGVWDVIDGRPQLLRPDYFAHSDTDFATQVGSFQRRLAEAVREIDTEALILQAPVVGDLTKLNIELEGTVAQPHWYDGVVLMSKQSEPNVTLAMTGWPSPREIKLEGRDAVLGDYRTRLQQLVDLAEPMGSLPTLVGETGIPYDLNGNEAYETGDFTAQETLTGLMYETLERALASYLIWNYTSDNTNAAGDGWNNEDLSIYSRDQGVSDTDINAGGRTLTQVVRPYPLATAGTPTSLEFEPGTGAFTYSYAVDQAVEAPTRIFVPALQYPRGHHIEVTGGVALSSEADVVDIHPDNTAKTVTVRIGRR